MRRNEFEQLSTPWFRDRAAWTREGLHMFIHKFGHLNTVWQPFSASSLISLVVGTDPPFQKQILTFGSSEKALIGKCWLSLTSQISCLWSHIPHCTKLAYRYTAPKPLFTMTYRETSYLSMKAGSKSDLILLKPQVTLAHGKNKKDKETCN